MIIQINNATECKAVRERIHALDPTQRWWSRDKYPNWSPEIFPYCLALERGTFDVGVSHYSSSITATQWLAENPVEPVPEGYELVTDTDTKLNHNALRRAKNTSWTSGDIEEEYANPITPEPELKLEIDSYGFRLLVMYGHETVMALDGVRHKLLMFDPEALDKWQRTKGSPVDSTPIEFDGRTYCISDSRYLKDDSVPDGVGALIYNFVEARAIAYCKAPRVNKYERNGAAKVY